MDIAIIGMAGKFPDAKDLGEFYNNLENGVNSIKDITARRKKQIHVRHDLDIMKAGYMEGIENFDHKFFNLSFNEARHMDPNQRLLMEVVYEAFDNSGYNVDHFNNSNTSVWVGETPMHYQDFVQYPDPTLVTGNLSAMMAGRIARFFNLRGAALTIGTACSSSLVALHYAINELRAGQCDHALVCGTRLYLNALIQNNDYNVDGIHSDNGKICSFSSGATGTLSGEAVICILLKPLEKAVQDKDIIHAVIKGSAVNQDAGLSGSLTAPDSIAQSEVLKKAWTNARIDPATITHIEAHGTGTKLGDPIEVQGLDLAFSEFTGRKNFCALSTVKTYTGHADGAAGILGLIKAVLSLKSKKLFPLLNFDAPNPFIDFANSAMVPVTTTQYWETPGGAPRRAGVSSFGLSGTNCHVVLEEAPQNDSQSGETKNTPYLVTVSARDAVALAANIRSLHDHILSNQPDLENISYTLNTGRKHYEYRFAAVVKNRDELIQSLGNWQHATATLQKGKKIIFIFSDIMPQAGSMVSLLSNGSAFFLQLAGQLRKDFPFSDKYTKEAYDSFIFQYCFYKLIETTYQNRLLVGDGLGQITCAVLAKEISLAEAFVRVTQYTPKSAQNVEERCKRLVNSLGGQEAVFVEMGLESYITRQLRLLQNLHNNYSVITADDQPLQFIRELYLQHYPIEWTRYDFISSGRKIELPAYQFNKINCWLFELPPDTAPAKAEKQEKEAVANNRTWNAQWTETQNRIAVIWDSVLNLQDISLEDDFFEIGGHSLNGNKIVNSINQEFNLEIDLEVLFDHGTIRDLSTYIDGLLDARKQKKFIGIEKVPAALHYEVSHAQKRLWILSKLGKNLAGAYNIVWTVTYNGRLDLPAFTRAVLAVMERHESLRTVFEVVDNLPRQKVVEAFLPESFIEFAGPVTGIESYVKTEQQRLFNLETGPLLHITVLQTEGENYLLLFNVHHIIFDGWSMSVFNNELLECYDAFTKGEQPAFTPLQIQYKDFSAWQNSMLEEAGNSEIRQFWLDMFNTPAPDLQLPLDYPRPDVKTYNGNKWEKELDQPLISAITAFSSAKDATLFTTLLSALYVLLYRYTTQTDMVIGTPVAGRQHVALENQVGLYVNTLPLRLRFSGNDSFDSLLDQVKKMTRSALSFQSWPFDRLLTDLDLVRNASRNPLFDVMMAFYHDPEKANNDRQEQAGTGNSAPSMELSSTKFDLTVNFHEAGNRLLLGIEYNTDLFSAERIQRMGEHFIKLISGLLADSAQRIDNIDYLTDAELHQLIFDYNNTEAAYPKHKTFIQLFEEQVNLAPHRTAVISGPGIMSYRELNEHSNKMAWWLREQFDLGPGDLVGISVSRSEWMLIALLGIWKSGAGYVPVDKSFPAERKQVIVKDSGMKFMLVDEDGECSVDCINFRALWESDIQHRQKHDVTKTSGPQDIAYVIYTSGSTGIPKGVQIAHRSVINFLTAMLERPGFSETGVMLAMSNFVFDISVVELYLPLLVGARIVMADKALLEKPQAFHELWHRHKPTFVQATPGVWRILVQHIGDHGLPLTLLSGGECLNSRLAGELLKKGTLWNVYGPTETTVWATAWQMQKEHETQLIGHPLNNTGIYILDSNLKPRPIGVEGEIYIGGEGVAIGYLNRDTLMAERFIQNPFRPGEKMYRTGDIGKRLEDGNIAFIGRTDDQVKVRGHRVEPGEVENVLSAYSVIDTAVVMAQGTAADRYLTAYYKSREQPDENEIRKYLESHLPAYMVPMYLVRVTEFPLTVTGKIDRARLVDPGKSAADKDNYAAPVNGMEAEVISCWEKVLNKAPIGLKDDFFRLGGDSIKAIQISILLQNLGYELEMTDLFRYPVVERLAAILQRRHTPPDFASGQTGQEEQEPQSDITALLQNLWQEVLNREQIGLDENFFDLAGSSIMPVLLLRDRYRELKPRIRLKDIFNFNTITKLATHLREPVNHDNGELVKLTYHDDPARPTIVFVPPAIGLPVLFLPLAEIFGEAFNCYSFLFNGYEDDECPAASLHQLVEKFCDDMHRVAPTGPIVIFGYSWGVTLAYELAKKMEAMGKTIKLVLADLAVHNQLYEDAGNYNMEEYDSMFEHEFSLLTPQHRTMIKKVFMNNNRLMIDYKTTGKLNSGILAIEASDNDHKTNMHTWKEYTNGQFMHIMLEGNHWDIFNQQNITLTYEKVRSFIY